MNRCILPAALALCATAAGAAPVLMTPDWMAQACAAWNKNAILTGELGDKWVKNDKQRGYKIVHMYRTECGERAPVEMKIEGKDGKAYIVRMNTALLARGLKDEPAKVMTDIANEEAEALKGIVE